MDKEIKVSVIVPVFQVEQYLDRTIHSLLNQTLTEIEIILVDDGSLDNCPVMCDDYTSKYSHISVIHKKNAGLGMACNSGIEVAQGKYIAFCDSDDYVDFNMYKTMYDAAEAYHADAVYTGIQTVNQNGIVKPMNSYSSKKIYETKEAILEFAMNMIASEPSVKEERSIPMSAKVVLYRKEVIDAYQLRFMSERVLISEDLIWNIDFMSHSNCVVALPNTFYYYYQGNSSSITKRVRTDRFVFYKTLREDLLSRCKRYGFPDDVEIRINRMFIGYCRSLIEQFCLSNLSNKEKHRFVSDICQDTVMKNVLKEYPVSQMPFIHLIITILIKYNYYHLISLIYHIRRNYLG